MLVLAVAAGCSGSLSRRNSSMRVRIASKSSAARDRGIEPPQPGLTCVGAARQSLNTALLQAQHEFEVLHRRARGALAQIVEPRDQHRLMSLLVGVDIEFEPVGVIGRLRFELAVRYGLGNADIIA